MTKEPIMIDDVDVTECENLYTTNLPIGNDKVKCGLHQGIGKTCNDYPNCYYKQLQKEKIAYKNLLEIHNEDNAESNKEREELLTELKRKEQECDQLKAENIIFTLESRKLVAQYSSKIERLKQALQEIKEFVENEMKQDVNTRILLQKCEVIDV